MPMPATQKSEFTIRLTVKDSQDILAALHKGNVDPEIIMQFRVINLNLLANGDCPECGGNGQLYGDYGNDWHCQTCSEAGRKQRYRRDIETDDAIAAETLKTGE